MSRIEEIIGGSAEHKNVPPAFIASSTIENSAEGNNASLRLHTSQNSTISNDSDLSLLSLSLDKELDKNYYAIDIDELPVFEIRLISPLGRTPSPIHTEDIETPTRPIPLQGELLAKNPCHNNPEFVALHDINSQISPPSDNGNDESFLSRTCSLETIYEGVFLNTPPRHRLSMHNRNKRSQTNLTEKVTLIRFNEGKENEFPISNCKQSPQHKSLDPACKTINHTEKFSLS